MIYGIYSPKRPVTQLSGAQYRTKHGMAHSKLWPFGESCDHVKNEVVIRPAGSHVFHVASLGFATYIEVFGLSRIT